MIHQPTRRAFGMRALAACGGAMAQPGRGEPGAPDLHLFTSEAGIESQQGLRRTVHEWERYPGNPVLTADRDWEREWGALIYGSVLYDDSDRLYRMWYFSGAAPEGHARRQDHMLYATSHDGMKWSKPQLGLHVFNGSSANNICMVREPGMTAPGLNSYMETFGVLRDSLDPDERRRFKTVLWETRPNGTMGVWTAVSPDGLRWTKATEPTHPQTSYKTGIQDTVSFFQDIRRGLYVAFVKKRTNRGRARFQMESRDFVSWTEPRLILEADERDGGMELYNNTGFDYGGNYLGWLERYDPAPDPYRNRVELELIFSPDGQAWRRMPGREAVLPVGPDGSWDRTILSAANSAPIRVRDRLYLYYAGRAWYHPPFKGGDPGASVGLATLRLDGFVSLDASPLGGVLTTVPLEITGSALHVNLESRWGHCRIGVLRPNGDSLSGFSPEDCEDIRSDSVDHRVRWNGRWDIGGLRGTKVRLRFQMSNTRLYSYRIL